MSQDHTPDSQDTVADLDTLRDAVGDDEFESIGDHHRMAAHLKAWHQPDRQDGGGCPAQRQQLSDYSAVLQPKCVGRGAED